MMNTIPEFREEDRSFSRRNPDPERGSELR